MKNKTIIFWLFLSFAFNSSATDENIQSIGSGAYSPDLLWDCQDWYQEQAPEYQSDYSDNEYADYLDDDDAYAVARYAQRQKLGYFCRIFERCFEYLIK